MRKFTVGILLLFLTNAAPSGFQDRSLVGREVSARVVSVIDGDTVDVIVTGTDYPIRIRLEGIDAPERGEAFSSRALVFMRVLLFDKHVRVEGKAIDRYGRLVARITIGAEDASVQIADAGLACHYRAYSSDPKLDDAETRAREAARGFWAVDAERPHCVSRGLQRGDPTGPVAGPFHGNTSSRLFHSRSCRNFDCKNCTKVFQTEVDARTAGFRPAGDCLRRARR